jgi:hypothetical protein
MEDIMTISDVANTTINNTINMLMSRYNQYAWTAEVDDLFAIEAVNTAKFGDPRVSFDTDFDGGTLFVYLPMDKVRMNHIAVELTARGWTDQHDPDITDLTFNKRIDGVRHTIFCFFNLDKGATCKLVKIGEREGVHMYPIYEMVCNEMPEEEQL